MRRSKLLYSAFCPTCGVESNLVKGYKNRKMLHYRVGGMESLTISSIQFRCTNSECNRKTFTHNPPQTNSDEIVGRSRYTRSSKAFVANKMLAKQTSYNSFYTEIKEDFGAKTAYSTIHRWTSERKVVDVALPLEPITVVHSDEKHPSKKRVSDKKFVVASAGRIGTSGESQALHASLAENNGKESLRVHYKELIDKGLDADKVELVVTDMLPAYIEVIAETFPNAAHQYCVFHFIQALNRYFKTALKDHRMATFEAGNRKEAHRISFLLLKGYEKLSEEDSGKVHHFCEKYPTIAAAYALKEDIRTLYATVKTPAQAIAYKDMINDMYSNQISQSMQKGLAFFNTHFDKTISFLDKGYFLDRTNNDAERMMRMIKRTQQTHLFLRNEANYIKKIRIVLGIQTPNAA